MKLVLFILALVGFSLAKPLESRLEAADGNQFQRAFNNPYIPIYQYINNIDYDGTYNYLYETGNGINVQEQGFQRSVGNKKINTVKGSYSYTAPNGQLIVVNYEADENGFRASGDYLPTPPPIPDYISRALQSNAINEANGIFDDGQYKPEKYSNGK